MQDMQHVTVGHGHVGFEAWRCQKRLSHGIYCTFRPNATATIQAAEAVPDPIKNGQPSSLSPPFDTEYKGTPHDIAVPCIHMNA